MSDSISPSITCALLILASRAIGLPLRVCVRVSVCACVCACMCMRACVCVCFSTSLTNTFAFIPLSPHISDFLATFLWQPSPPPLCSPESGTSHDPPSSLPLPSTPQATPKTQAPLDTASYRSVSNQASWLLSIRSWVWPRSGSGSVWWPRSGRVSAW